jgi:hypothetical protein
VFTEATTVSPEKRGVGSRKIAELGPRLRRAAALCCIFQVGVSSLIAGTPETKYYAIDLTGHTLTFSVPVEVANQVRPLYVQTLFDPANPGFQRNGVRQLEGKFYQFRGPIWTGTYGWFQFDIDVVNRDPTYGQSVRTLDSLDRYIRLWAAGRSIGFQYSRKSLSGVVWLQRLLRTNEPLPPVGDGHLEDIEAFSVPLNDDMFLQVIFRIAESDPGSADKWIADAEQFREAIEATLVIKANEVVPMK